MEDRRTSVLQLFVRLLDGRTRTLNFASSYAYGSEIKRRIFDATKIPEHAQRLISSGYQLADDGVVAHSGTTVHVVLSLRGGKGGFGSLLRGAATKAGQKKTNNFDACRDMSGRRLRHVNAEKRLEEWKAEEEERKLEKIAEDFIKKQAKKGKKGVGDGEAHKYVEKYREDSARCVQEVELAVKEACERVKRKAKAVPKGCSADAKRLKIWMGKRTMVDSDDDSSGYESNDEQENSVVLNNGSQLDSNNDNEGSSDSVTGARQDGASTGGASSESGSEEEKEPSGNHRTKLDGSPDAKDASKEENGLVQLETHEKGVVPSAASDMEVMNAGVNEACPSEKDELNKVESEPSSNSSSRIAADIGSKPDGAVEGSKAGIVSGVSGDVEVGNAKHDSEKPLNFDDFSSAAEMEALGMERLKSELQAHGLKCGGTLQERAARLFLLKSTPLEKIPKKLLAKK